MPSRTGYVSRPKSESDRRRDRMAGGTQLVLDAWLASDGGSHARAALLSAPEWHYKDQAGFTSMAFLRMFERLRLFHKAHKVAALRAFDKAADGSDTRDRNVVMADRLMAISRETTGLTMILVGNVHASRKPLQLGPDEVRPATDLLPESQRITIGVTSLGAPPGCAVETAVASMTTAPVHRARPA